MQTEKPSDAKSRIQVYVRVRPPNAEEQEESLVFVDKQNARVVVKKQFDVKSFDFDYVFAQESTQEEIFNTVAIPTIEVGVMCVNNLFVRIRLMVIMAQFLSSMKKKTFL